MATWLKQSTAVDIALGPFLDETDGKTAESGLTISQADVRLKKNAGNWGQKNESTAASHEENGWYEVKLDDTDTNTLGILVVAVHESGALPVWREFMVMPANIYDSLVSGSASDYLDVSVVQLAGSAIDQASGLINANVKQISGDAGAADNLEAACDGNTYNVGGGAVVAASVTGAVGSVTGNVGGNVTGSVGSVATGGITAASIADAAIDNATFAADVGSTAYASNIIALAVRKVLDELNLDHLIAVADADDVVNDSIIAKLASKGATADWSDFDNTTDSLQANRDNIGTAGAGLTAVSTSTYLVNGVVAYDKVSGELTLVAWLEQNGVIVNASAATAIIYDAAGSIVHNLGAGTEDSQYAWKWTQSGATATTGDAYYVVVTIDANARLFAYSVG